MRDSKYSRFTNWIYLISALTLLIGLIGCSPSSEGNSTTPSESEDGLITPSSDESHPANEGNTNTPSEINLSSESGDVVITFSSDQSPTFIEPLIETFHEENPSITVQFVPLTADELNESPTIEGRLLMLATSADTTLTFIRTAYTGSYFLDLQPLIDMDASFDQADFWSGTLSGMEDTQGRITGLPMAFYLNGIFYDKTAFDAANLSYPQPGWTWDDFRSAAAVLTHDERYGYVDRTSTSILRPLVGYELALNDGEINAETLASELEWYMQMADADQILALRSSNDLWSSQFTSDSSPAMWAGSLSELALGSVTGEPEATDLMTLFSDSAYGYAPYPVDTDGEDMNTTPITALYGAISRGSEHPRESWEWLKFLSEHWLVDKSFASNQLHIPARQSVAEAEGFWDNYPPEVQDAIQYGLEHAWFSSLYSQAQSEVLDTVQKVVVLDSSLISALEDTETKQATWTQEIPDVPEITIVPPQPKITRLGVEIELYFDRDDSQGKRIIAELIDQFNRDHKDEIFVKESNLWPKIPADYEDFYVLMADNYDCLFVQKSISSHRVADSGAILDLTALMEAEDAAFQQDFDPQIIKAAQYNGGLYILPVATKPRIMAYNADLLASLGLEPPSLDWTFEDFLEMITAISSSSQDDPIYGAFLWEYEFFYAGRGVQWKDTTGNFPMVTLNTQEMADAFAWKAELYQSNILLQPDPPNDQNWPYSQSSAMRSGRIGFWSTYAGMQEVDYVELPFNVGIVPYPATDSPNGPHTGNSIIGLLISSKSEHPEACWELAKYISESVDVMDGVPVRLSVANSPEWEAFVGEDNAAVYRAAISRNQTGYENDPYESLVWAPIPSWLSEAETNSVNGNDSAQELAQAQQMAEDFLACMAPYDVLNYNYYEFLEANRSCASQVDPGR